MKIQITVSRMDAVLVDERILSGEERARLNKATDPGVRRTRLVSSCFARETLGAFLKKAPHELTPSRSAEGKPFLTEPDERIHFSLSHSADLIGVAISSDGPVGFDLQKVAEFNPKIVDRVLSTNEKTRTERFKTETEARDFFFAIWTMKEAVLKCIGSGFMIPMNALETADASSADGTTAMDQMGVRVQVLTNLLPSTLSPELSQRARQTYWVRKVELGVDYMAHLAWRAAPNQKTAEIGLDLEIRLAM